MTSVTIPDIEHVEWCGTVAGRGGSLVAVCLTEREQGKIPGSQSAKAVPLPGREVEAALESPESATEVT